ncbi:MAG TPA: hypothetical protein PLL53_16595 [Saprospiraceae bacterium]|nr:hypothetical protein [Saprospiraceae bacterium]
MGIKEKLTLEKLIEEAQIFCVEQSKIQHSELYGITDGKAVGTLIEHKFQTHLVTLADDVQGIEKIVSYNNPQ